MASAVTGAKGVYDALDVLRACGKMAAEDDVHVMVGAEERSAVARAQRRRNRAWRTGTNAGETRASKDSIVVVHGIPFQTIIDMARAQQVNLSTIGTHGRTGLPHVLLGSVAKKCYA